MVVRVGVRVRVRDRARARSGLERQRRACGSGGVELGKQRQRGCEALSLDQPAEEEDGHAHLEEGVRGARGGKGVGV